MIDISLAGLLEHFLSEGCMAELRTVPVQLRVHLCHATVQAIADEVDVDILHIKGPAVDPVLRPWGRGSADADVLVRPSHLKRLAAGLARRGWRQVTTLSTGGLIEHSTNWYHGELGQLDVHVRFPGIGLAPDCAFDVLWHERALWEVAHRPCVVPGLVAQRVVLLLHAARDMPRYKEDVKMAWGLSERVVQDEVERLVRELQAEVAFAVIVGRLEEYRDRPEYALWRLFADGTVTTSGFGRLRAELRAAPAGDWISRARIVGYAFGILVHMPRRLAWGLAKKPSFREVVGGYFTFLRRVVSR